MTAPLPPPLYGGSGAPTPGDRAEHGLSALSGEIDAVRVFSDGTRRSSTACTPGSNSVSSDRFSASPGRRRQRTVTDVHAVSFGITESRRLLQSTQVQSVIPTGTPDEVIRADLDGVTRLPDVSEFAAGELDVVAGVADSVAEVHGSPGGDTLVEQGLAEHGAQMG